MPTAYLDLTLPPGLRPVTARQKVVLDLFWAALVSHQRPPTVRGVVALAGLRHTNTVQCLLTTLGAKGWLTHLRKRSCGWSLSDEGAAWYRGWTGAQGALVTLPLPARALFPREARELAAKLISAADLAENQERE